MLFRSVSQSRYGVYKSQISRDFFDLVFLMGRNIKPEIRYLEQKLKIRNSEELKDQLILKCQSLDMKAMAVDVAPFLFNPADEKRVRLFEEYLVGYAF